MALQDYPESGGPFHLFLFPIIIRPFHFIPLPNDYILDPEVKVSWHPSSAVRSYLRSFNHRP